MKKKNTNAFTLVELIVVITILAILGTIAFISLQGYSKISRDSVRISDIGNLAKTLEISMTVGDKVPKPENAIELTASGTLIGYQGEAGVEVLSILGMFNGGKDPLEETYYTYATNEKLNKYQVLGFLEDGSELSENIGNIKNTYAKDLSKRYVYTKGNEIGVLLDPVTSEPVNKGGVGVDLVNTNEQYKLFFSNTQEIVGTGTVLKAGIGGGGLVGYWDFEEIVGSGFIDKSGNNINSVITGGVYLTGGIEGNGIYLNGTGTTKVIFNSLPNLGKTQGTPHTISAWIKPTSIPECGILNICRQWILLLGNPGNGSHHWLIGGKDGPSQFGIWSGEQKSPNIQPLVWQHIVIVFDGSKLFLYKNGILENKKSNESKRTLMNIVNANLVLGNVYESIYNGYYDEIRIYNRALSGTEIKALYNSTK